MTNFGGIFDGHCGPGAFGMNFMCGRVDLNIGLTHHNLVVISKDGCNLLQWFSASIRVEKPHDQRQEEAWNDETEVELPADVRKRSRCELQPEDIRQGECGDAETDSLGSKVRREDLGQVTELGTVDAKAVENAEDEHHGNACSQGVVVVGAGILSHQACLPSECSYAAKHADRHVLGPWETINQQHGKQVLRGSDDEKESKDQQLTMCIQAQSREQQGRIVCEHHS